VQKLGLQHFILYAHGPDLCHDLNIKHALANCFEAVMGICLVHVYFYRGHTSDTCMVFTLMSLAQLNQLSRLDWAGHVMCDNELVSYIFVFSRVDFKRCGRCRTRPVSRRRFSPMPADSVLSCRQPTKLVKPPKNLQAIASQKTRQPLAFH